MGNESEQILNELKKRISTYIELKAEWVKLTAYERIAKIVAVLSHSLISVILLLFALLFVCITLGFFIGEQTGSTSLGFLVVMLLCILILSIVALSKKRIQNRVANLIIQVLREDESDRLLGEKNGTEDNTENNEEESQA